MESSNRKFHHSIHFDCIVSGVCDIQCSYFQVCDGMFLIGFPGIKTKGNIFCGIHSGGDATSMTGIFPYLDAVDYLLIPESLILTENRLAKQFSKRI